MRNYVKVEQATLNHPDGPVQLWVKGCHVILTATEAREVATELEAMASSFPETPPPPVEPEPAPEPEPGDEPPVHARETRSWKERDASAT